MEEIENDQIYAKIAETLEEVSYTQSLSGDETVKKTCSRLRQRFGIEVDHIYCGGYESLGYCVECYAIAAVTSYGTLVMFDYQHETFKEAA